jgi:hypothetical protein
LKLRATSATPMMVQVRFIGARGRIAFCCTAG